MLKLRKATVRAISSEKETIIMIILLRRLFNLSFIKKYYSFLQKKDIFIRRAYNSCAKKTKKYILLRRKKVYSKST